jgi:Rha family phage regulatory protein
MKNEVVEINGVEVKFNKMSDSFSVSSRDIASVFEKRHDHVLRDIEKIIKDLNSLSIRDQPRIGESIYRNSRGKTYTMYQLDRDAFSLLVMGFTGKKAFEWKVKYIEAFNKMEAMIKVGIKESEQLKQENKDLLFIVKELGFTENSFKPTKDGRIKTKLRKSCLTADTSKDKEKQSSNVKKANKVVREIVKSGVLIASRNLNPYEKYLKRIGGKDQRALI